MVQVSEVFFFVAQTYQGQCHWIPHYSVHSLFILDEPSELGMLEVKKNEKSY